ncbi:DUF1801 domain-containing protein [Candidatus Nomurabacteria bacterium]|nr:DUF1801 domain-containing protein [Candidatus Nomurabacteria bacterium]
MAELKTKKTTVSPTAFIATVKDPQKRADAKALLTLFKKATGLPPKMWGSAIVGFGQYHYKSNRSSQEGDWPLTGFSPRAATLTIYIMPGFKDYGSLLKKLGKHKISGGSCIYIKKLADVDQKVLAEIIKKSVRDMRKKYKV